MTPLTGCRVRKLTAIIAVRELQIREDGMHHKDYDNHTRGYRCAPARREPRCREGTGLVRAALVGLVFAVLAFLFI